MAVITLCCPPTCAEQGSPPRSLRSARAGRAPMLSGPPGTAQVCPCAATAGLAPTALPPAQACQPAGRSCLLPPPAPWADAVSCCCFFPKRLYQCQSLSQPPHGPSFPIKLLLPGCFSSLLPSGIIPELSLNFSPGLQIAMNCFREAEGSGLYLGRLRICHSPVNLKIFSNEIRDSQF